MLNILLLYFEPIPAGQTAHVLSLARALENGHHRVTVVLPARLEGSIAAFRRTGVCAVPLPMRKLFWSPQTVVSLARLIHHRQVDIVHIHSQEAGLVGRVVARMAGAPRIIYTPQTIDIQRIRWHGLYARVERMLARVTDVIVSVNGADRARLIRWGIPSHKVVTVPNGIDLSVFKEPVDVGGLRRELGLDEHRPLVMQVARLSAQKDPLAFVEGAARVIRERPDVQFALVGAGPLRERVTSRIRSLGLEGQVHLLGWREEAFKLMPAADVISLTSRWEGAPYTLLEAMAWSRPVVATAVNGCPETVIDGCTGFLAPPGDTGTWARRVVELVNDPQLRVAMGRRGRRQVEERFTLYQMFACMESLYQQTARAREGPRHHQQPAPRFDARTALSNVLKPFNRK